MNFCRTNRQLFLHKLALPFQALCCPGTIVGFDEDNDVIVSYPGGNR